MLNFMALGQPQECFFLGEFSQPRHPKKKAGESNKGIFEILKKKIAIS
jgi:hypothetical protein